jgi:hypothetical protein
VDSASLGKHGEQRARLESTDDLRSELRVAHSHFVTCSLGKVGRRAVVSHMSVAGSQVAGD